MLENMKEDCSSKTVCLQSAIGLPCLYILLDVEVKHYIWCANAAALPAWHCWDLQCFLVPLFRHHLLQLFLACDWFLDLVKLNWSRQVWLLRMKNGRRRMLASNTDFSLLPNYFGQIAHTFDKSGLKSQVYLLEWNLTTGEVMLCSC